MTATGTAVTLRGWTVPDLDVFRTWLRPEHDWHRWDGPYYPAPTDEQADGLVAALAGNHGLVWPPSSAPTSSAPPSGTGGLPPGRLVVDVDGQLVGTVAWYWESRETEWARMGITVYDPATRGQGIGRSAMALWTSLLFERTRSGDRMLDWFP